jgi:hypothetical protein
LDFSGRRRVRYFDGILILYIYLTAVCLTPGGSSTSHIYTQTVHIIQRKENWEVRAVPRLSELYPDICLKTEGKARFKEKLSLRLQGRKNYTELHPARR